MSVVYDFEIVVSSKSEQLLLPEDIIESLRHAGWDLYTRNGQILFTALGDKDDFDIISQKISRQEYYKIAEQKYRCGETVSFSMFCDENGSEMRIDVMIMPDFTVAVFPDDFSKKILPGAGKLLDVSWYTPRLIPCLNNEKMIVERYCFNQC